MTMTSALSRSALALTNSSMPPAPFSSWPSIRTLTPTGPSGPSASRAPACMIDAGLVVGGAAAVEATVALGGLERRARPGRVLARRLHVVVRVQEDGRRAGRSRPRAEHGLRCACDVHHAHVGKAGRRHQLRHGGPRLLHRLFGEPLERHGGQAHELLELRAQSRHQARRLRLEVVAGHRPLLKVISLLLTGCCRASGRARSPGSRRVSAARTPTGRSRRRARSRGRG